MGTILAGVDNAPTGRDAAVLACALAAADDAVLLADVRHDPLLPVHQALRDDDGANEPFAALAREFGRDAATVPVRVRTSTVAARSRARALLGLAEREDAATIVLGSSRRCAEGEAFAGRTARQVLHGAPHAVALAVRGLHERGCSLQRIVVGIDGSPEGRAALAAAVRLSRAAVSAGGGGTGEDGADIAGSAAHVHVVAVADDTLPVARTPLGAVGELTRWDEIVEQARTLAERLVADATAADPALTGEVRVGGPPEELAAVAAERRADLLVVGSRHWGPRAAISIGSTAEELLRGAPCSLLLVPRPATD